MSNQAKDWQKGYYTVLVDGKTIAASKKIKTGKNELGFPTYKHVTVTAQCAPEDEFNLSMGVALAMDRLSKELDKGKIEVGDKVKIKDYGQSYTTYVGWIKKNINDVGLAACFAYDRVPDEDDTVYVVKAIAPWDTERKRDKMLAYVQKYFVYNNGEVDSNEVCYLMCVEGLEKV